MNAPETVTVRVPAKINLQLSVGPRRADGYHDLATLFCAVSLYDQVTVTALPPGCGLQLSAEGSHAEGMPLDETNLAAQAARLAATHCGVSPDAQIHLTKAIPLAGGMAGGSADAAATLLAATTLWQGDASLATLLPLAATLGSDVAFPLLGRVAWGTGRGEQLEPVPVRGTHHWVVAVASGGVSTPAAFAEFDRQHAATEVPDPKPNLELLSAVRSGDLPGIAAHLSNDLQPATLALRPELADTLAAGRAAGALAGLISGSGPTCLFLAQDPDHAATIAAAVAAAPTVQETHLATAPVAGAQAVAN